MAALRSISTRAAITTTSFTNHYEWGDLKANPSKLLEKYFDAFVYVANWGTHEFYIRLPQESVDHKLLKAMVPGETVRVRKTARFVIVEFGSESEWDGEDDGTGWMASLMPLRSDLLRGDLRCLYLGWLRSAQDGGLDEDELEPPVPTGLQELSGSLDALIEFLEINCTEFPSWLSKIARTVDAISGAQFLAGDTRVGECWLPGTVRVRRSAGV
ncbi:MAG: hypothetical protein WA830_17670 [Candidatus Sulfotelmatobacter sp.]